MKTIQFLVVLLLFCLSTPALAKGPFHDDDQELTTPALLGNFFELTFVNNSGHEISLHGDVMALDGTRTHQFNDHLELFQANGRTWNTPIASYVRISWFGQSDDLIVSFCSEIAAIGNRACVNVN